MSVVYCIPVLLLEMGHFDDLTPKKTLLLLLLLLTIIEK